MPQLIERGYLYIAQPPLYKVKRGSSELYLKNEEALQDYLIASTINEASFISSGGKEFSGESLKVLIGKVVKFLSALFYYFNKFTR